MRICLSEEFVKRYVAGDCSEDERRAIEAHLTRCEKCRQRIESAQSNTMVSSCPDLKPARETAARTISEETDLGLEVPPDGQSTKLISEAPTLTDATHPVTTSSFRTMIEGYDIIDELPQGGQAVVFKAVHIATKTNVAIKVLLPTLLASPRARYYFEREAELIARLDHPNIVRIRDSGIIHGQYYFVMEYVQGEPLNRYVRSQNLSFRERILLFNKICSAVTYAHQQGIIHRDLKFANILVDKRGEPHILDFGLAKAIGLSEDAEKRGVATMTGQWAGSLSTMSPEQAAGQPELIDVRTDVYSLGVILYYILTGRYPYDVTGSTLEVLQNIQKAEPVRPRQIVHKLDSDVEAILLASLAKERAERYQSAAELQSDIENWLGGRPIRVRSVSTVYLLRKIIARHRYTSTVAALLLLIILGFSYTSFDLYITAKKAQKESEAIAQQWASQAARNLVETRKLILINFLLAWQDGRDREARGAATYLAAGCKERKAADFLLDPSPLDGKEAAFRRELSEEYAWFADLIIGEHHLKDGNRGKAIAAYQRSYEAIYKMPPAERESKVDRWLAVRLVARLDGLGAPYRPAD